METLSSSQKQSWLSWFFRGFIILGFMMLLGRAFDLQIIRGSYFRSLAEDNRIRQVPLKASRGTIYARNGEVLVGNIDEPYHIVFNPLEGYTKEKITDNTPEDEIVHEPIRTYILGSRLAHVSGYLGLANEKEAGKVNPLCVEKGPRAYDSFVGRGGLEESYECILAGIDGEELIEVDSSGKKIRSLGRKKPVSGEDITTTIHFGLQTYIADIVSGNREFEREEIPEGELNAAVVVSNTKGEILALYSSPTYDPSIFIEGDSEEIAKLFDREDVPLFNRVLSGTYHPGSVFKPLVGIAAFESDSITPDYTFNDTGSISLTTNYGTFTYRNWYFTQYGGVEGEVDMARALARSTDTYFYKIGELTGIDNLVSWSEKFNLGVPTGIDIPGEVSGLIPNPEWKKLAKGERWFLGNTYHFSIGQNDIVLTPLQINAYIASLASAGEWCRPHLVSGKEECHEISIKKASLEPVVQGMQEACSSGGTAFSFFEVNDMENDKYKNKRVACKTGTAQVGVGDDTHAWFTFFTPFKTGEEQSESEIITTILVEKGGEGSKVAGPIGKAIYDYWYGFLEHESEDDIEPTPTIIP